jgi:uncharacterized protein YjbI with pentapeptide repeats
MAEPEHVRLAVGGASSIADWRKRATPFPKLNLSKANLAGTDLTGANLSGANLAGAILVLDRNTRAA